MGLHACERESKILFGGGEVIFNSTTGYMVQSMVVSSYFLDKMEKILKWRTRGLLSI